MPYATVGGQALYYRRSGPDPAEPGTPVLVLLHGAGGSGRHWRWAMEELPRSMPAIAVDLPGHGRSEGVVPGSIDAAGAAVDELVQRAGIEGPVAVAGHSMGGVVALALALSRPGRVSHLAIVASAAHIRPHPLLLRQLATGEVDEAFVRGSFAAGVAEERQRVVIDDLREVRTSDTADFMGAGDCDLRGRLAAVTAPVLVVAARSDLVVSPRKSRALAEEVAGARLVLLDGGHYIHIERPNELAALLTAMVGQSKLPHREVKA